MNLGHPSLSAGLALAVCALAGCATTPQAELDKRAADVRVYRMDQTVGRSFDIVGRVWGDSWRSALVVPTFPAEDAAIGALRSEAVRLGADGLVNVNCLKQVPSMWSQSSEPPILCYAVAVRFRQA
jgi:uncharacterized protein YbjQ (UPF0145 family)